MMCAVLSFSDWLVRKDGAVTNDAARLDAMVCLVSTHRMRACIIGLAALVHGGDVGAVNGIVIMV